MYVVCPIFRDTFCKEVPPWDAYVSFVLVTKIRKRANALFSSQQIRYANCDVYHRLRAESGN